jgi:excisionase family DNA binding protein
MSDVTEVLSINQVAEILGVNRRTVERAIREDELRAVKRGGRWYIRAQALEDFLTDEPIAS